MDHQSELEKSKYRNWVKGGLAFKYLNDGLVGFADDVVQRHHKNILNTIHHKPGTSCNQCSLKKIKPLHKSVKDQNTGKDQCPWGQRLCNCTSQRKQSCQHNICDAIYDEVLKSHGSSPPAPNWRNTNPELWCSQPWEIGKCFINAPGYLNKSKASDIDTAGLLHLFINNKSVHSYISCAITGSDILSKTLKKRNQIFHSPKLELDKTELDECINDIIEILEDDKELKNRQDAKQAVEKLKQLKQKQFIVTTFNEEEVCRTAMTAIIKKTEELELVIKGADADIRAKEEEVSKRLDEKTQTALDDAISKLGRHNESVLDAMKQTIGLLHEKMRQLEVDNANLTERIVKIENESEMLKDARIANQRQLQYVVQKQELQRKLVGRYQKFYVKTGVSPLKYQEDEITIQEVYTSPYMVVEEKRKYATKAKQKKKEDSKETGSDSESESNTKPEGNKESKKFSEEPETVVKNYHDIFHTNGVRLKKIYIVGDVGTGKSAFSKMMIYNWCKSVDADVEEHGTNSLAVENKNGKNESKTDIATDSTIDDGKDEEKEETKDEEENIREDDVKEMRQFDFLFFIPLQRMTGNHSNLFEMIQELNKDILPDKLLKRLFEDSSENCCIIIDGLDEWIIPKKDIHPKHISYGIPNSDTLKNATTVTLSRPSAKGMLNLKSSEYDKKIKLKGIHKYSLQQFTRNYFRIQSQNETSEDDCLNAIKDIFKNPEKSPILLQQLIWLFYTENDIGTSVSDVYSHIVNIMFGWQENKVEDIELDGSSLSVPKIFE